MFADVVFNRPIPPLTYRIPRDMELTTGVRVRVELKNSETVGIVHSLREKPASSYTKPIKEVLDTELVINEDLMQTAEWMARYYLCSIGEALWTVIPKGIRKRGREVDEAVKLVFSPHRYINPVHCCRYNVARFVYLLVR